MTTGDLIEQLAAHRTLAGALGMETAQGNPGTDGTFPHETRGQTERFLILFHAVESSPYCVVNVPHHVTQRGNARQFPL